MKRKREESKKGGPYLIKLNKLFISLYYIIDKFKAKSEHSISNVATVFHLYIVDYGNKLHDLFLHISNLG